MVHKWPAMLYLAHAFFGTLRCRVWGVAYGETLFSLMASWIASQLGES